MSKKRFRRVLRFYKTQVIIIVFFVLIMFGAVLLNLPIASRDGQSIGFLDALFTATSATCVTGLVVVDTYQHWTLFGQVVIISLIQIGGLGFMTMATLFSLLLRRTISLNERLLISESLNYDNMNGIVRLVKHIIIGTAGIEFLGMVLLSFRFIPEYGMKNGIYKSLFHSVSAFCNAGFDIMGQTTPFSNLTKYVFDPLVVFTICGLIIVGGIGFFVWEDIY
ncbi:MAG: Trk family potassium uptake protein, partial [Clostridiaceae bacterium]|nr:Trk family potassium uptake protein [Clostridiaceae bacterium]